MADRPGILSFVAALVVLSVALELLMPGTVGAFFDFMAKNFQVFFLILMIFVILYFMTRGRR